LRLIVRKVRTKAMNLGHLSYFAEVARLEHLTNAARALNISPSAVSHAIARLEEEIGCRLFERDGKRIVLTFQGRRLAERVEGILRSVDTLKEDLDANDGAWTAHYRVAGTHGLASDLLAPALAELQSGQNGLRADLSSMRTSDILRAVVARELDYAIGYNPVDHPEMVTEVLREGRLLVVARPGHPLTTAPRKARPSMLKTYPHASVRALFGTATCEDHPTLVAWQAVGRVPLYFDSYDVAERYVLSSDAWAIMPEWPLGLSKSQLAVVADLGAEKVTCIAAMWPKSRRLPAPLVAVHEAARKRLAALPVIDPAFPARGKPPAQKARAATGRSAASVLVGV
jgi:DNA-binding transcriptional LysR family regulator